MESDKPRHVSHRPAKSGPPEKRIRVFTEEARLARRLSDKRRARTRINIGGAFRLWKELRRHLAIRNDSEMAFFLIDSYENRSNISTSCRARKSGQSPPQMSSIGSQCLSEGLRGDFNIKEEEEELEARTLSPVDEFEVSIDWDDNVSEGAGSHVDCAEADCDDASEDLDSDTKDVKPDCDGVPEGLDGTIDIVKIEYEGLSEEQHSSNMDDVKPECESVSGGVDKATGRANADSEAVSDGLDSDIDRADPATDSDDPDYTPETVEVPESGHRRSHDQTKERQPEAPKQHQGCSPGKKNYDCPTCGKAFPRSGGLRRHLVVHSGKRPYKCFICERGFTQSGNLKTHMKVHKGDLRNWTLFQEKKESPVIVILCGECGMEFPSKQQLEEHRQSHKKPFSCPECDKSFKNEVYFELHKRIHSGESLFVCSECGKSFVKADSLKNHQTTHTGAKNFRCKQCGKAFSQSSGLRVHLKTHTGERPHLCSICGKSYTRACYLKVHLRLHTGENPYMCDKCGKCFYFYQSYRQHLKIHDKKPKPPTKPLGRPKEQQENNQ